MNHVVSKKHLTSTLNYLKSPNSKVYLYLRLRQDYNITFSPIAEITDRVLAKL